MSIFARSTLVAVLAFTCLHLLKERQVLLYGTIAVGALLARLRQCASVFTDLICRQITDICLALAESASAHTHTSDQNNSKQKTG